MATGFGERTTRLEHVEAAIRIAQSSDYLEEAEQLLDAEPTAASFRKVISAAQRCSHEGQTDRAATLIGLFEDRLRLLTPAEHDEVGWMGKHAEQQLEITGHINLPNA